VKSFIMHSSPASRHFLLLRFKYSSSPPCSQTPSICVISLLCQIKFHTHEYHTKDESTVAFIHKLHAFKTLTLGGSERSIPLSDRWWLIPD